MGRIKSVFFDIDGTLTYSKKPNYLVFWKVLANEGFRVSQEKVKEAFAKTKKIYLEKGHEWKDNQGHLYRDLNKIQLDYCSIEPKRELVDKIQEAYKDAKNQALYPDVLFTLKNLKQRKYILGTLTGGLKVDINHRLKILEIKDFFSYIIATGTMPFNKPDPHVFKYVLKVTNLPPEEMVYVGNDYEVDIVGAESIGMRAILVDRENRFTKLKCERMSSLKELLKLLN